MALAPSANTVQVSAESVQNLRLHRACSNRVRCAMSGRLRPTGTCPPEGDVSGIHDGIRHACGRCSGGGTRRARRCCIKVTGVDAALRILGTHAVLRGRLVAHLEAVEKWPGEQHPHGTLQRPGEHQWEPESHDGGQAAGHQRTEGSGAPYEAAPGAADPSHEIGRREPLTKRDGDDRPCSDGQTDDGESRAGQQKKGRKKRKNLVGLGHGDRKATLPGIKLLGRAP